MANLWLTDVAGVRVTGLTGQQARGSRANRPAFRTAQRSLALRGAQHVRASFTTRQPDGGEFVKESELLADIRHLLAALELADLIAEAFVVEDGQRCL